MAALCGYSIHTHAQEIRQGYISLPGGGRVGLCGQAILQNGELRGIEHIASLNLRIAREIPGAADPLMAAVYSMKYGMLIYGPPGSGKTTILKDVIRQLTDGSYGYHTVAAADERGELQCGTASLSTLDHLLGYPKHIAVTQAAGPLRRNTSSVMRSELRKRCGLWPMRWRRGETHCHCPCWIQGRVPGAKDRPGIDRCGAV